MTTGEKIKELRTRLKLTQQDFADSIGVSRRSIMDWEHDRYSPQTESIKEICRVYNLDLNYFLADDASNLPKDEAINNQCINNQSTIENENIEEFKGVRKDLVIGIDKKIEYRDKLLRKNKIYKYYRIPFFLIFISIIVISALLIAYNANDVYYNFVIIAPIIFYLLYKYLMRKYILKSFDNLDMEIKKREGSIENDYPIYTECSDTYFRLYDNDHLIISVLDSDIKKISLSMNNQMFLELLPKLDKNVYTIGMEIYYSNGEKSYISIGFPPEDKLYGFMYSVSKLRLIDNLNKIYVRYKK